MKTILVINDNSPAALRAAKFAGMLAQCCNAAIIMANTIVNKRAVTGELSLSNNNEEMPEDDCFSKNPHYFSPISIALEDAVPVVTEIDISNTNESTLAELINRNQIWMMVKGVPAGYKKAHGRQKPKVHIVLNEVKCPLLLIPEYWPVKMVERITYISDLRYCNINIVRYLTQIAGKFRADVSFAHLTAKGLPDMGNEQALSMFTDEICRTVKYDQLFFNKIREKDFSTAVDVIVNGMENDILAFVNHHFHIEEILGDYGGKSCLTPITVPVLIFPY